MRHHSITFDFGVTTMSRRTIREITQAGHDAFYAGAAIEDNPHKEGYDNHEYWENGYLAAVSEHELETGDADFDDADFDFIFC